ncbi:unnamed protein product [Danaus chrysippus]|uniref:ethanolamine kinase n=1 Tax=Danaus chrysippus TaxID=151541 RepID=A0A8J2QKJ7_9NEOP|nr:unnamed protein product [Danaus chrysippus]
MSRVCQAAGHKFIPYQIKEDDLYGGISNVLSVIRPEWPSENIKYKLFTDGITNKLVACQLKSEEEILLVRIYGNKTDLLIDRDAEIRNITLLNKEGLAPKIYGVFRNGLVYEYYPGVTLTTETVIDPKISTLVARQMARMHKVQLGPEVKKEPMIWDKIEQFLNLIPEQYSDPDKQARFERSFVSPASLRSEFSCLQQRLAGCESPLVFAHNDLLLGNVVLDELAGSVAFIDYEYAGYNYQAFDIANHFNEYVGLSLEDIDYSRYPCEQFQRRWVYSYLTELQAREPREEDVSRVCHQVRDLAPLSHFLWGAWALVQSHLSDIHFDFLRYAEIRLGRYYELKEERDAP